jgi:hypothetical protein
VAPQERGVECHARAPASPRERPTSPGTRNSAAFDVHQTQGDSAMPANPIKITVHVKKSCISCTPKGGHAHLHQAQRDQIRWVSEDPAKKFTLAFSNFETGADLPWPFLEGQAGWPTADTGPLTVSVTATPLYIKYSVQVSGCDPLDPIIIVDN